MPSGGYGVIAGAGVVVGLVEVVEGRGGNERMGRESVDPVGDDKGIALGLAVTQPIRLVVIAERLPVGEAGVVRNLKEILAVLRVEAQLILRRLVAKEGEKTAFGVGGIVVDGGDRRSQAVVGAGAGEAQVPGGGGVVVAERELGFAAVLIAGREQQFALAAALEAVAGQHIEDAVCAVACFRVVAAALGLQGIDVPGIDLRAHVGGDLGVGNSNAVDQPTGLVAAPHVQHVVGHVGARDVVGDHLRADGSAGAGGLLDVGPGDERGGGCGIGGGEGDPQSLHLDALDGRGDLERNMHHRVGARGNGDRPRDHGKVGSGDSQPVDADGRLGEFECALGTGSGAQGEGGIGGFKGDRGAGDGPVLRIVDYAMHGGEDGGQCGDGSGHKQRCRQR